eukprot:222979-Prorocentrum_minimum.AAC.2
MLGESALLMGPFAPLVEHFAAAAGGAEGATLALLTAEGFLTLNKKAPRVASRLFSHISCQHVQRLVTVVQRLVEAEALRDVEEAAADAARAAARAAEQQRLQVLGGPVTGDQSREGRENIPAGGTSHVSGESTYLRGGQVTGDQSREGRENIPLRWESAAAAWPSFFHLTPFTSACMPSRGPSVEGIASRVTNQRAEFRMLLLYTPPNRVQTPTVSLQIVYRPPLNTRAVQR